MQNSNNNLHFQVYNQIQRKPIYSNDLREVCKQTYGQLTSQEKHKYSLLQ